MKHRRVHVDRVDIRHQGGRVKRRGPLLAAVISLTAALCSAAPSTAQSLPLLGDSGLLGTGIGSGTKDDPLAPVTELLHPELDFAGAQIARIEGIVNGLKPKPAGRPEGLDVSSHQGVVDWNAAADNGAQFAYVKATEGLSYHNPGFSHQYNGSAAAGLIRGAYHFALPNVSSGRAQADYFLAGGGGWSGDGITMPPAVDLEYNPYGSTCYGKSPAGMVAWVSEFSNRIHQRTGRYPAIYTSTNWWNTCTGSSRAFGATNPLWVPRYGSSVGALPAGWSFQTIWQYANHGKFVGDQNYFNGNRGQLQRLAAR